MPETAKNFYADADLKLICHGEFQLNRQRIADLGMGLYQRQPNSSARCYPTTSIVSIWMAKPMK